MGDTLCVAFGCNSEAVDLFVAFGLNLEAVDLFVAFGLNSEAVVAKSNNAHAAKLASVLSSFRDLHLATRAYIAVMLHVIPDLIATMMGTS